jgi:hypothetical protein
MKRIIIEIPEGTLNTSTNINLEEMQPVHYSLIIAELETQKLIMISKRNKFTSINKNDNN